MTKAIFGRPGYIHREQDAELRAELREAMGWDEELWLPRIYDPVTMIADLRCPLRASHKHRHYEGRLGIILGYMFEDLNEHVFRVGPMDENGNTYGVSVLCRLAEIVPHILSVPGTDGGDP